MIKENISQVLENIKTACEKSGRNPEEVTLVAVSKTKPVAMLKQAYEAGSRDFGENKVQEIMDKYPQLPSDICEKRDLLPDDIRWHMIGHLQRNKVKYIIEHAALIHSVDSLRLAEEISRQAQKKQIHANILVEVNIAQEESKRTDDNCAFCDESRR